MVAAIAVVALAVVGGVVFLLTRGSSSPVKPSASVGRDSRPVAAPTTAAQWRAAAIAAANAAGSAHVESIARLKGRTVRFSDDDGADTGVQRITVNSTMHGEVRVIGKTTYFAANQAALAGYFGFPKSAARQLADRWLVLHPGDPGYSDVTSGVTLRSTMKEAAIGGKLTMLPKRTLHGVSVVGIRGGVSGPNAKLDMRASATLWVSASAPYLPVVYEAHSAKLGGFTVTFSRWGVAPKVLAPAAATPLVQALSG